MAATLTEKSVPDAKPKDKPYEIYDRGGKKSVRELLLRVQPSGAKNYYVQIARGKRERVGSASQYTLAQARNEARKVLGKAADGHDFQAERRHNLTLKASTLGGYLDGAYKDYAEEHIAGHRAMLSGLKKNFSHVLKKPMTEITELDMAKWQRKRGNVTLETRRRELSNLKAVLNHAIKTKVIPSHQLSHYRVKGTLSEGEGESKVRFLSEAEEKRLRAAMDAREERLRAERRNANKWREERGYPLMPELGPHQYADHIKPLILLALNTGLRRGDLFDLQWGHVDLERRQIRKVINKTSHVRRKAGKKLESVVLPLSAEAHAVLTQQNKQRHPESEHVFASPRTGGRLDNISKAFGAVVEAAKIRDFRFHDLRHTFASRLVMAGVDINTVRELMTHSDIKMTLVYAHLSPDHKAAAVERAFGGVK